MNPVTKKRLSKVPSGLFLCWKEKGTTAIIADEKGDSSLMHPGLEEYVSDCVILPGFRASGQIDTRRFRIINYRGLIHGTNKYPFQINENGISVLPVTSLKPEAYRSKEILSPGLKQRDEGATFIIYLSVHHE